jgi:hypothetical protein
MHGVACGFGAPGEAGKIASVGDANSSPQIRRIAVLMFRKVWDEKLLCKVFAG